MERLQKCHLHKNFLQRAVGGWLPRRKTSQKLRQASKRGGRGRTHVFVVVVQGRFALTTEGVAFRRARQRKSINRDSSAQPALGASVLALAVSNSFMDSEGVREDFAGVVGGRSADHLTGTIRESHASLLSNLSPSSRLVPNSSTTSKMPRPVGKVENSHSFSNLPSLRNYFL